MKSISCVAISLAIFYQARYINKENQTLRGAFFVVSWLFLCLAVLFMVLGI